LPIATVVPLAILAMIAGALPFILMFVAIRRMFRRFPDHRFVPDRWVDFSNRFGPLHGAAAILLAFLWVRLAARVVPQTPLMGLLVFGFAICLLGGGVCLIILRGVCWAAGVPFFGGGPGQKPPN
jgi:hypothetical protein